MPDRSRCQTAAQDAPISAAGRLLVPDAVRAGLGAQPGDAIVFGGREDGSFEVEGLATLIERTTCHLRDVLAGRSMTDELIEGRRAEAREADAGDPLAGAWAG